MLLYLRPFISNSCYKLIITVGSIKLLCLTSETHEVTLKHICLTSNIEWKWMTTVHLNSQSSLWETTSSDQPTSAGNCKPSSDQPTSVGNCNPPVINQLVLATVNPPAINQLVLATVNAPKCRIQSNCHQSLIIQFAHHQQYFQQI